MDGFSSVIQSRSIHWQQLLYIERRSIAVIGSGVDRDDLRALASNGVCAVISTA